MDARGNKPLLQESTDDDSSEADFVIGNVKVDTIIPSTSTDNMHENGSSIVTRRLHNDHEDDYEEEDDGNNVNDNLTKELLRNENAPHDKYNYNYIIFYLLGMTTLLPWNFFITAEDVSPHHFSANFFFFIKGHLLLLFYKKQLFSKKQ